MKTSNSNKNSILLDESKEYEISIKSLENDLCFTIAKNKNITLILRDFKTENNVDFLVENDSIVDVKIINETGNRNFNFSGKIKENSALNIYYADLSNSSINFNSCIDLIENNAKGVFKFCTIANKNNIKKYNISFDQLALNTSTLFEGYGVSLKNGTIDSRGISHIAKDCKNSEANQKIKVILFDKDSKAKASPTLKIDCDDIVANHACAIGSLNEDHIFYLKSRGLSEQEARKLITLGYLLPIKDFFNDKQKEIVDESIKEIF